MKYEGKVTITLENTDGVKISRPFDVEFDEDLTLGESPFLFEKAINIVDKILFTDIEQVTLDAFSRHDAAEKALGKTREQINAGTLDTPGMTVRTKCENLNEIGGCKINEDCNHDTAGREARGCMNPVKKKKTSRKKGGPGDA